MISQIVRLAEKNEWGIKKTCRICISLSEALHGVRRIKKELLMRSCAGYENNEPDEIMTMNVIRKR